ncbi:alpha/beta fold hydrolase [Bacillus mangrovi]|uniref:Alpha/beta fold hydrolase n=1 Tax=Metabacillus mangrovi TaxID=1491830 RepID=A0A7X2V605_9BACI|nr:alpha/beta hydrolase [Metabacillus mangrovi]MTH54598.1 alpha/beta fold hydrolase [Metabacillus mangrovi]
MDLHAEIKGSGRPIILIHGSGTDLREWVFIVPYLQKTCRVIAYDMRGSGKSPSPAGPMDHVKDLQMVMDDLHLTKAIIVGHSRGGQVACDFALADPSRIDKLILISPNLTGYTYSSEYENWLSKIVSAKNNIPLVTDLILQGKHHTVVAASRHYAFLKEMVFHYVKKTLTEWKSYEMHWPEPPAILRLKEMKPPTLFIQGTREFEDMYQIKEHYSQIPSIESILIPKADSMTTLTHPEEIAENILAFMQ